MGWARKVESERKGTLPGRLASQANLGHGVSPSRATYDRRNYARSGSHWRQTHNAPAACRVRLDAHVVLRVHVHLDLLLILVNPQSKDVKILLAIDLH